MTIFKVITYAMKVLHTQQWLLIRILHMH
jgi:hypothetical protein